MSEYAELIKALRYCRNVENCYRDTAANCPYNHHWVVGEDCNGLLEESAADALEAADEKIADCVAAIDALDDSNDAYIKEIERLKKQIAELEDDIIYWQTYAAEIER